MPSLTPTSFPVSLLAIIDVFLTVFAFLSALGIAVYTDYPELVKTHCSMQILATDAPLPRAPIPRLSAVIGDQNLARLTFRLLIVWTIIPKLVSALGYFHLFALVKKYHPKHDMMKTMPHAGVGGAHFATQMTRLTASIIWVLTTSRENMALHTTAVAFYIAFTLASNAILVMMNVYVAATFHEQIDRKHFKNSFMPKLMLLTFQVIFLIVMAYYYNQHNKHCTPGSYTKFAIAEWAFAFWTLCFDGCAISDLSNVSFLLTSAPTGNPLPTTLEE
jgi:hypothetical protein